MTHDEIRKAAVGIIDSHHGALSPEGKLARAALDLVEENERWKSLLSSIERRCGSASQASAFSDAHECAQWIRNALQTTDHKEAP